LVPDCLGVNFINILCNIFSYENALRSFSKITFYNFLAQKYWRKNIGAKGAHKMLMKLTTIKLPPTIFSNIFY